MDKIPLLNVIYSIVALLQEVLVTWGYVVKNGHIIIYMAIVQRITLNNLFKIRKFYFLI